MITQDQLKDISTRISKLKGYLEIDKKLIEITNEEEKTANPDFWNNPKEAEKLMKDLRFKKKWVEDYNKVITFNEDLNVLYDFYKEDEVDEKELEEQFDKTISFLEDIEFKNMLSDEGDSLSATLQITAGAGGTESCDWAEMLFRMYKMWSEKQGFKLKTLNYQAGDTAGIKTGATPTGSMVGGIYNPYANYNSASSPPQLTVPEGYNPSALPGSTVGGMYNPYTSLNTGAMVGGIYNPYANYSAFSIPVNQ